MFELLYTSWSARPLQPGELASEVPRWRGANAARGVTGCFGYHGRRFIQLIEGPQSDVLTLFAAIQKDPRHTAVNIICSGGIVVRSFADEPMAFVVGDSPTAPIAAFEPIGEVGAPLERSLACEVLGVLIADGAAQGTVTSAASRPHHVWQGEFN